MWKATYKNSNSWEFIFGPNDVEEEVWGKAFVEWYIFVSDRNANLLVAWWNGDNLSNSSSNRFRSYNGPWLLAKILLALWDAVKGDDIVEAGKEVESWSIFNLSPSKKNDGKINFQLLSPFRYWIVFKISSWYMGFNTRAKEKVKIPPESKFKV